MQFTNEKIQLMRNRASNPRCVWFVRMPRFYEASSSYCFSSWREAHFFMVGIVNRNTPEAIMQMMKVVNV